MKSLICNLDGTNETLEAALTEAEYFANLCVLSEKQCLHLRLLAEELLGMASGLLQLSNGTFWVEEEERQYELHLNARVEVGSTAKEKLLNASSTGKNEMHKGVTGKIRQALEWLSTSHPSGVDAPIGIFSGMMLTLETLYPEWSLECYRESLSREEKALAWDEMEKSVLGKLADDVRVGVNSDRMIIVIRKKF